MFDSAPNLSTSSKLTARKYGPTRFMLLPCDCFRMSRAWPTDDLPDPLGPMNTFTRPRSISRLRKPLKFTRPQRVITTKAGHDWTLKLIKCTYLERGTGSRTSIWRMPDSVQAFDSHVATNIYYGL